MIKPQHAKYKRNFIMFNRYCEWYVDVLNAAIKQPDSGKEEMFNNLEDKELNHE